MTGSIKLGGRLFTLVNYAAITSLNEHYVMKLMRETGLDKVLPEDDGLPSYEDIEGGIRGGSLSAAEADRLIAQKKESDAEYFARLQQTIVDTLRLHELLAGYLLPIGKTESDFTLDLARETTRFLQGLQSPDDRAEIHRLGSIVTLDFFKAGVASLNRFRSSSSSAGTTPKAQNGSAPTGVH